MKGLFAAGTRIPGLEAIESEAGHGGLVCIDAHSVRRRARWQTRWPQVVNTTPNVAGGSIT